MSRGLGFADGYFISFQPMSMTAPPPEISISGGYNPTGLRRALGEARLPVGCCCYANKQRSKVPEPSMICVFIADGWLCLYRTVHDIGLWRGRFASEIWTVRDIESQRGGFAPGCLTIHDMEH